MRHEVRTGLGIEEFGCHGQSPAAHLGRRVRLRPQVPVPIGLGTEPGGQHVPVADGVVVDHLEHDLPAGAGLAPDVFEEQKPAAEQEPEVAAVEVDRRAEERPPGSRWAGRAAG